MIVRVSFDAELQRSTIERIEPAGQSSTRLDLGAITMWLDTFGVTELTIDEPRSQAALDDTLAVVDEVFGAEVAALVAQRRAGAVDLAAAESDRHRELAAMLREVDLDRLRVSAPRLAALREPSPGVNPLIPVGSSIVAALVSIRFDVSGGESLDAVDPARPARVTWDRTNGELLVRIELRGDSTVPPGWWLRVVDGQTNRVVAAAPVQPHGVASTVVAPTHGAAALGLRVARGVTDEAFRREEAARERLRMLESLAREAEALGDASGASAAWATAASFAEEIFEDAAAAEFRKRSARERNRRRRRRLILVIVIAALVAIAVASLASGPSSNGEAPTRTSSGLMVTPTTARPTPTPTPTETSVAPRPPTPADASGQYSYLVGEMLGPLFEEIGVELSATSVRGGETVTVVVTQVLDAPSVYPSAKYDECMTVIGKDRTVQGVQTKPTPTVFVLVPVGPGSRLTSEVMATGTPVSVAQDFAPIVVTKVIRCGIPTQGSEFFGTADRLYMGAVAIELPIPDLEPGSYAVVPLGLNGVAPSAASSDPAIVWVLE